MIVSVDTGKKRDLTARQMAELDDRLRARFPKLVGWSYSPMTGQLDLDFGDEFEEQIVSIVGGCKAEGKLQRVQVFSQEVSSEDIGAT